MTQPATLEEAISTPLNLDPFGGGDVSAPEKSAKPAPAPDPALVKKSTTAPATPATEEASPSISDFELDPSPVESLEELEKELEEPKPKADVVKKPEEAEKKEAPKEPVAPEATNSEIRNQLIAANERAKSALEEKTAMETRLAELEEERNKLQKEYTSQKEAIGATNVAYHPEVRALSQPWDDRMRVLADAMDTTGGNGDYLRGSAHELISEWSKVGESGSDGFNDRRAAFVDRLRENFGDDAREVGRLIAEGVPVVKAVQAKMKEISENSTEYQYKSERKSYDDIARQYDDIEAEAFAVSPELRESDPFHPKVIIDEFMKDSEELKERKKLVEKFQRKLHVGLAPVSPKELESMSDKDRAEFLERRIKEQDRLQVLQMRESSVNWLARDLLVAVTKKWKDAEARLKDRVDSTPRPDDGVHASPAPEEADATTSAADFEIDPMPAGK